MPDYSSPVTTHKSSHPPIGFVYIIPLGLVLGFFIFALLYVMRGNSISAPSNDSPKASPTQTLPAKIVATATPTAVISPTPAEVVLAKDEISIVVQNGSGVAGAAGKIAKALRSGGFTEVTTGNADSFTFTNITIRYVKGKKAAAALIQTELEKQYTIESFEEAVLAGAVDVEVTAGKITVTPDEDE